MDLQKSWEDLFDAETVDWNYIRAVSQDVKESLAQTTSKFYSQRYAYQMFYEKGVSEKNIGILLGISESAVSQLLTRFLKKCPSMRPGPDSFFTYIKKNQE